MRINRIYEKKNQSLDALGDFREAGVAFFPAGNSAKKIKKDAPLSRGVF